MPLQAALVKDPGVSVNRVIWSPDGSLFGKSYYISVLVRYGNFDPFICVWVDNQWRILPVERPRAERHGH
ncbi:hypothetical protein HanLR1_Chr02g0040911 [Helianthus annuus]|nr:hypothetical protein HanLR1_Chr02g0040911 [Helianthus annuus]